MPFKRGRIYYIQIKNLPGYGRFPETSTYVSSKTIARQMESLLRQIAEKGLTDPGWYDLLKALRSGHMGQPAPLTLPELLRAHHEHRLPELRRMLQDPLLSSAIEQYLQTKPGYVTEVGLDVLQRMAEREFGASPRFGILRSGKNITLLCARAKREGGRPSKSHPQGRPIAHNSALRTVHLSASKLLRFHLGNAERDRIFADVSFSRKDDSREVWLSRVEIARLIAACKPWFRPVVVVAMAVGADRSPLLRLRCKDVQFVYDKPGGRYRGQIYLRDTKTDARPRSVALIDPVCRLLLPLVQEKQPEDRVFDGPPDEKRAARGLRPKPINRHQVRYWFEVARKGAGLEHVRFKDLRHTWAVNADNAGLTLGEMAAGMGHSQEETTVRYAKRQVTLDEDAAWKVGREMGLDALFGANAGSVLSG